MTKHNVLHQLQTALGDDAVVTGDRIHEDYGHDEALSVPANLPKVVLLPSSAAQVASALDICNRHKFPVTARGRGTGLSGGCTPVQGGAVLSLERMDRIIEVDPANHVAVVEPGVTLAQLEKATRPYGLVYPIMPGEASASIGGNVATNAGGMRAVKYGVTRNNVLGLQAVLANGDVIRCGGKFVKSSSGLDLGQLIIGSEGQLAIVTEVTTKLVPFQRHRATILLPFQTLDDVTRAVPRLLDGGIRPLMLEYIDIMTMAVLQQQADLQLNIPQTIKDTALAYLVVVLEAPTSQGLQADVETVGELAQAVETMDMYALPQQAGSELLAAREQAFWLAKKSGAGDIVDVVVPRASMSKYMAQVSEIGQRYNSLIAGCGHAGDGNVHLSVFETDAVVRKRVVKDILAAGMLAGGVISAEHGIGADKRAVYSELEDPTRLALMKKIKAAFDPNNILNPGKSLNLTPV